MTPDPGIHQHIARPGIETAHRRTGQQQRKVGNAADVQHHTPLDGMPQQRLMKRRHQRRALPAVGHIAPAEIADGGDIGQRGDAVVVAELHRETRVAFRFVPHRLAVATDGGDLLGVDAGLLQQAKHRLAKQRAQLCVNRPTAASVVCCPWHPQDLFFSAIGIGWL